MKYFVQSLNYARGKEETIKAKDVGVNPTNGQVGNGKGLQITTFNDDCHTYNSCSANLVEIINFFWGKENLAARL